MTEQEYDEQIAPALLELSNKVAALGGSFVARVEWALDGAGITAAGMTEEVSIGQKLANIAARCGGNLDALVFHCLKHYDTSRTVVGRMMRGSQAHDQPKDRET